MGGWQLVGIAVGPLIVFGKVFSSEGGMIPSVAQKRVSENGLHEKLTLLLVNLGGSWHEKLMILVTRFSLSILASPFQFRATAF